jgi:cytochrome c553
MRTSTLDRTRIALCGLLLVAALIPTVTTTRAADPAAGADHFEAKVRPLLVARCFQCHAGEKTSGGLALDSREGWQKGGDSGPAILPGEPEASLLLKAVRGLEGASLMPPEVDHNGEPLPRLSADEIGALVEWVKSGAADPRVAGAKIGGMSREEALAWWAFQPLSSARVPEVAEGASIHNDIDRFLQARLDAAGIAAAPAADRRTLIRRATYDLTGLPPTADEVDAFLADPAPLREAFGAVVDRLMKSPQYGVQWGRHWLDVVRYADTAGENTDRPLPHAWRYRNWVFDAVNADMPWGEFVRLQVAGDILRAGADDSARREGLVATGYLAIARRFGHDIDKDVHLMHEDLIDNLGKNLLGLTTGCARCHDHKYDPVSAEDYYALYGILDGTKFPFPGCEAKGQPRDLVPLLSAGEVDSALAPWKEAVAARDAVLAARDDLGRRRRLKSLFADQSRVFQAAAVGEGGSVPIAAEGGAPHGIDLKKGEVIQLTVSPNGNHGADTTLVDLRIECATAEDAGLVGRRWMTADLAAAALPANPLFGSEGDAWCFIEPGAADGPAFLAERKEAVEGKPELVSWVLGELPSAFANTSPNPVRAWTDLSGQTFFVHPAQDRPVAVAWVCPADGRYLVSGAIADAHPAALDGVSFTLAQVAGSDSGEALVALGRLQAEPLPEVPPQPILPVAYAVVEGQPHDVPVQQRGDPEKPGSPVPRRWLEILGGEPVAAAGGSGRRQLAGWIAGSPLATRVIVNRLWQWHFGAGLVRTPNDFGSRGEAPSHPELLDWLAARFEADGGSMKAFHRLVMDSAAYQRSGILPGGDDALQHDPDNKLLGRFASRRLSAEEIRDSLLAAAGTLDPTPAEGHPFPPEKTWGFSQHAPFVAVYDTPRRSAYMMVQRQRRHPFLALFDGADPNASTPKRQTTTMPTQALYFLNDPFFHSQAAKVVQRVAPGADDAAGIARLYRLLFGRPPLPAEIDRAYKLLAAYPGADVEKWGALARVLMASNEFLYLD